MEEAVGTEIGEVPKSALPHTPQKRFPAGLAAPHAGHIEGRGVPHPPQNRFLAGFWCPQLRQEIPPEFPVPCGAGVSMDLLQLPTWPNECYRVVSDELKILRNYAAGGAGGRSPLAGVRGVPAQSPSFSRAAAGGARKVPE